MKKPRLTVAQKLQQRLKNDFDISVDSKITRHRWGSQKAQAGAWTWTIGNGAYGTYLYTPSEIVAAKEIRISMTGELYVA